MEKFISMLKGAYAIVKTVCKFLSDNKEVILEKAEAVEKAVEEAQEKVAETEGKFMKCVHSVVTAIIAFVRNSVGIATTVNTLIS